ncbi:MAG: pyridoxal phosphate-dependent aminotransferase [Hyphomonadaceae bacterium]
MRPASARAQIANFLAMEMARDADIREAAGHRVVHLHAGQPSTGAPKKAIEAVKTALSADALGYTEAKGSRVLREAISRHYAETYGVDVSANRIVITTGASGAFTLAFLALFDTGDRIAMCAPGYPPYRHILTALGMKPAIIEATGNDRMQLQAHRLDELAHEAPIHGVLAASPANPAGAMLTEEELRALSAAAHKHKAPLISDEIYHGMTYERPATTALSIDPDAIVINSFSKYWSMTGWRIGWIVAPDHLVGAVERLTQNLTICPPHISQVAALAALGARDECEERMQVYATNRRLILDALPGMKLPLVAPPDGAFYVLADISAHGDDSLAFAQRALQEAGVAVTPGVDFDERRGKKWIRIAYARATGEIEEGLERLARFLA